MQVSELMRFPVQTISPEATLLDAQEQMFALGIRHLPVVEGGAMIGLISQHDILRGTAEIRLPLTVTRVAEVMTAQVVTIHPDASILEAIGSLASHDFSCLPVVRGEHLVGILTHCDLLQLARTLVSEQDAAGA